MFKLILTLINNIKGFIEVLNIDSKDYKCAINEILQKPNGTYIKYKIVGCRIPMTELATNLNTNNLFTLFRPDHAQIIISIATLENVLKKNPSEIYPLFESYINKCNKKITGNI